MSFDISAAKGAIRGVGISLKNASPTIMVVGGIGLMVTSTVLAVKESDKGKDIVAEWSDHMDKANTMIAAIEDPEDTEHVATEDWNVPILKQAKIKQHVTTAKKLAKNYAPAIFCGLAGIGLILGGHGIQIRRISMLGGALEAVSTQFDNYRENVVNTLGSEADTAFLNNGVVNDITMTDADGKQTTVKNAVVGNPAPTALSILFDESNPNWSNDAQANKFFLECAQKWAQNVLDYSGQISLAEVYKHLGINLNDFNGTNAMVNKIAYAIGWKRGDIVDFGLSELFVEMNNDGNIKYEPSMWLTPNCRRSMFDGKLLTIVNKRVGISAETAE